MYFLLFMFWIILNGHITTETVLFGLALTAGIGFMINVLYGYSPKKELAFLSKGVMFISYIYFLIKEIVLANLNMMGVIVNPDIQIEPVLVSFHSGLKTGFGNFVLANSITLTPGTITVSVKDDLLTVHCLKKEFLDAEKMIEKIREMEA